MKTKMRMKVVCICRSMYRNGICMVCMVYVWLKRGWCGLKVVRLVESKYRTVQ